MPQCKYIYKALKFTDKLRLLLQALMDKAKVNTTLDVKDISEYDDEKKDGDVDHMNIR